MDITSVKVNQGCALDFFELNDETEGDMPNIFVPNYKPSKSISSVVMVTFENDMGGSNLVGVRR